MILNTESLEREKDHTEKVKVKVNLTVYMSEDGQIVQETLFKICGNFSNTPKYDWNTILHVFLVIWETHSEICHI